MSTEPFGDASSSPDEEEYEYTSDEDETPSSPSPTPHKTFASSLQSDLADMYEQIASTTDSITVERTVEIKGSTHVVFLVTINRTTTFTIKLQDSNKTSCQEIEGFDYYPHNFAHLINTALSIFVDNNIELFFELHTRIERKKAEIVTTKTTVAGGAGSDAPSSPSHTLSFAEKEGEDTLKKFEDVNKLLNLNAVKNRVLRLYRTLSFLARNPNRLCPVCCHMHELNQTDMWPCQDSIFCIWQFSNLSDIEYLRSIRRQDLQELITSVYNLFTIHKDADKFVAEFEPEFQTQLTTFFKTQSLLKFLETLDTPDDPDDTDTSFLTTVWQLFAKSNFRFAQTDASHLSTLIVPLAEAPFPPLCFSLERFTTPELLIKLQLSEKSADFLHTTACQNVYSMCSNGALIFSNTSFQKHGAVLGTGFYIATNYSFMSRYFTDKYQYTFVIHATDTDNEEIYTKKTDQVLVKDTSKLYPTYVCRKIT